MRTRLSSLLLLATSLAGALPAHATVYSVGPGRTHTQLSQVANLVGPGDVIELDGNATYDATALKRSGTREQPITLRGTLGGAQRPVIDAKGAPDGLRMDVSHWVVEDLVITNAARRCVFLHGANLTLRRVVVRSCRSDGILGADQDTGDITLTEVEVHGTGNPTAPNYLHHAVYIATDHEKHPEAVLTIEKSWIHDNYSGNAIKSRARTLKVLYNWIETSHAQDHAVEAIGPDPEGGPSRCPGPDGANDARLCSGEIVGNVLVARSQGGNMLRLGGDGTGDSFGRFRVVNNTFVMNDRVRGTSGGVVRAFGGIQSIELHNNIFWLQAGDSTAVRIVRDVEAKWTHGRRVVGTKNLVTGRASAYATGEAAESIRGLTGTIYVPTTVVFEKLDVNVLDLRLHRQSPARRSGNAGSTSTLGYQVPNPTNLPMLQPPMTRPSSSSVGATPRPLPTDDQGKELPGTISIGAHEYAR